MAVISFADATAAATKGIICSILAAADTFDSFTFSLVGANPDVYSPARGLRRLVCSSDPADDLPNPVPPFTGGQCPGTVYRVFGTYVPTCGPFLGTTRTWRSTADLVGPVSGVVLDSNNDSWFVQGAAAQSQCIDSTGFIGLGNAPRPGVTCAQLGDDRYVTNEKPTITSIQAISGPDNCGNPTTPVTPWPPGGITYSPTYDYGDENNPITISPTFNVFAPFVSIDGSIKVPITVDAGGINLNGNITIAPDFNVDLFPVNISPGGGNNPIGTTLPTNPDLDGEEPEQGPREAIVAVIVRSQLTSENRVTVLPQSGAPKLLVPGVATVRFAIASGSSISWTADIRVKGVNEFVPCPWPGGAVDVAVTPESGVATSFAVVRGEPLKPFEP